MKGSDKVIAQLNDILTAELTGVNQYWVHARMCENWGYTKLWEHGKAESIDEMKHADQIIARILYLDGVPNLQRLGTLRVGETVKEQMESDLEVEKTAIDRLNSAIELCVAERDSGTRDLLEQILVSEEEHADWLETQLELMQQIGMENYLANQV